MTEENFPNNKTRSTWLYDELGNITKKSTYITRTITNPVTNVTHEDEVTKINKFGYGADPDSDGDGNSEAGWNNLLTSVTTEKYLDDILMSSETETIDYDSIGNPTTYLGANLTWDGRQLTSYVTDDKEITYTYDYNGLRASKIQKDYTVAEDGTKTLSKTTETKYYYVNGQLHFQDTLATNSDGTTVVTKLHFYYDSYGYLSCIKYNGSNYYVATNKRGDVVALYYYDGRIMGRYEYDAWGNVIKIEDISYPESGGTKIVDLTNNTTSRDLLVVNPIRYRSYYYDTETELYYLQSRYYNAQIGRFLNADSQLNLQSGNLGVNMFAYANNNPITYSDPTGHSIILACLIGGAIIGAITGGAIGASVSKTRTGKVSAKSVVVGAVAGGAIGAVAGAILGAVGSAVSSVVSTGIVGSSGSVAAPTANAVAEKACTALTNYYPPNNGFAGVTEKITLEVGTFIQRTGDLVGRFVAPAGTDPQFLSLPADKIGQATTILQVQQPLQAVSGTVAPWFYQIGGGTQYMLDTTVAQLVAEGVLKIFGE